MKEREQLNLPPVLLDIKELGQILGVSVRTLEDRRCHGRSMPRSIRIGRLVRYRPKDVESWLDEIQEDTEGGLAGNREHQKD